MRRVLKICTLAMLGLIVQPTVQARSGFMNIPWGTPYGWLEKNIPNIEQSSACSQDSSYDESGRTRSMVKKGHICQTLTLKNYRMSGLPYEFIFHFDRSKTLSEVHVSSHLREMSQRSCEKAIETAVGTVSSMVGSLPLAASPFSEEFDVSTRIRVWNISPHEVVAISNVSDSPVTENKNCDVFISFSRVQR